MVLIATRNAIRTFIILWGRRGDSNDRLIYVR